jgi:glutamate-5-semialdehyde dehydrogenase
MKKIQQRVENVCMQAKATTTALATLTTEQKNSALLCMAKQLQAKRDVILQANQRDLSDAQEDLSAAFLDRLTLTHERIDAMINGIKQITKLPDPVGKVLATWQVPSGLTISRISVPLGVIAIIYESRPNVTADAAALCLKSGNAVILRGGSECQHSNEAITACLQQGLTLANINADAIQYMPSQDRAAVTSLLQMDQYIDVLIPRGSKKLIQYLTEHSKIPMFKHLDGICHTYIHADADKQMALDIINNAKLRRTGICGATETVLLDEAVTNTILPELVNMLLAADCEVRGDALVQQVNAAVKPASDEDWQTEYLDAIISIKVVENLAAALQHIETYSSHHTDAIITNSAKAAETFLNQVNSAIVMHNCSTQFADGSEFGMGAEIGIATGKLHARGPVGVEQLTTFKYQVQGAGQLRP